LEFVDKENRYNIFEDDNIKCYYCGSFYIPKYRAGAESIERLCKNYYYETTKYDDFYGGYRIILVNKATNGVRFLTDNAGLLCFYYDEAINILSDSFLEITSIKDNLIPNYEAITEFLQFGCVYSDNTFCNNVVRTDAMYLYCYV